MERKGTEGDRNHETETGSKNTKKAQRQVTFNHDLGEGNRVFEMVRMFENMSKNDTPFVERDAKEAQESIKSIRIRDRTTTTSYRNQDSDVLCTIKTPYGSEKNTLYRVLCVGKETLWITGKDNKIYLIDRRGSILNLFNVDREVGALSVTMRQELIYALCGSDPKIYKYKEGKIDIMRDLNPWEPFGLSCTQNDDILVSMRYKNEARVVQYSGKTETKTKSIQYYSQKEPLFSSGNDSLALTENGNGDICVADYGGECVVVVDASGSLRFKYKGNVSRNSVGKRFLPKHIATDVNHQIIVSDFSINIVHVIDRDSSLICYIKHNCRGGLSIDPDHHLLVGDFSTGKIEVIKYLKE